MSEDPVKYEPLGEESIRDSFYARIKDEQEREWVKESFGHASDPNDARRDGNSKLVYDKQSKTIKVERATDLQIRIEALRAAALVYSGMCANPNVTPGNSEMEAAHVLDWSEQFAAWLEGK